jgi:FdhE protein
MVTGSRTTVLEHVHQSFQAATARVPAYGQILPFFENLFTLEEASVAVASPDHVPLPPDLQAAGIGIRLPLLDRTRLPYDETAAMDLMLAICREAATATPQLAAGATAIGSSLEGMNGAVQRGLRLYMNDDDQGIRILSAEMNMNETILRFYLYHSTWPSVARQVSWIRDSHVMDGIHWDHGFCPICGSPPDLAFLAENGGRWLVCEFCRHQWSFERIRCPGCSNQDSHSVIYFFSDAEPAYRVHTCDVCKLYIKTVDTRRLERPFYPPLEGILTAHLDMKARRLGFSSSAKIDGLVKSPAYRPAGERRTL